MLIEVVKESNQFVYFTHIRFCTLIKSTYSGAIIKQHLSHVSTVSSNNVNLGLFIGKKRYSTKLWKAFVDCFNCMPVSALVEDKIICMHGGLSPDLIEISNINNLQRPIDVPDNGLLCDLLWADPESSIKGWNESERGVSYIFGSDVVTSFLKRNDLDLICRAHQVVEDGY